MARQKQEFPKLGRPRRGRTVCYACQPPFDWQTLRALEEHREKSGH